MPARGKVIAAVALAKEDRTNAAPGFLTYQLQAPTGWYTRKIIDRVCRPVRANV